MTGGFLHGGDIKGAAAASGLNEDEIIDFSANINPLGMLPKVSEAVAASVYRNLDYPDPYCRELREKIAHVSGHGPGEILCGNGGADLIYRLVYALKPECALIPAPAFAEYEEALIQTGTRIDVYESGENFEIGEGYADALEPRHQLAFICNPNNPTGLLTEKSTVRRLIEKAAGFGCTVCVDECFLDFVGEFGRYTAEDLIEDYPNLIILKSFTKLYAMPGLRLGYAVCSDACLLERMSRAGQPWGVSVPAAAAGCAALSDEKLRERTVSFVGAERRFLKDGLEGLGLKVLDGQANYLCFQAAGVVNLVPRALREGILLRSCANYRGMGSDWYRAAVRTREENRRLLAVLGRVLH